MNVHAHIAHRQHLQFQKACETRKRNTETGKDRDGEGGQLLITYWIVRRIAKVNFYSCAIRRVLTIKLIVIVFITQSHGFAAIFTSSSTHNTDKVIEWNEYVLNVNLFISSAEQIWRRDWTIVTFPLLKRHFRRRRLMDFYFNIGMVCFRLRLLLSLSLAHTL